MIHLWCRAPQGFALERVARVPYLCKGDQYKNYYGTRCWRILCSRCCCYRDPDVTMCDGALHAVLDDAIIVLRRIEDASATAAAGSGSGVADTTSSVTPGTRTAADASGLATDTAAAGFEAGDNEGSDGEADLPDLIPSSSAGVAAAGLN